MRVELLAGRAGAEGGGEPAQGDTMDGARDQRRVSEVLTPWGGQRQHSQVSAQLRESKGQVTGELQEEFETDANKTVPSHLQL